MEKQLPNGWKQSALSDLTLPIFKVAKDADVDSLIKYIDISAIDNDRNAITTTKEYRLEDAPSRAKQLVKAGDVLFSLVRPYLKNIASVPESLDGQIASTGFCVLRPALGLNERFLFYKAISGDFINSVSGKQYGVSYPAVKEEQVRSQEILLPPLNEQNRIVAKIEELFSELDKGIESLQTAREQLKVYRQAVLKHAFEGKLTEQWKSIAKPDEWERYTLGELLEFLTSGSRGWAKFYSESGDLFIRAQNLKYDRLDLNDIAFVDLPNATEGKRTQVQQGDLLITITGANVTKTGMVTSDIGTAYVSQHVALCRPTNKVNPEFLYWFLVSEAAGRRQLSSFAYGAGKPGLNLENIRSVVIDLPSISEQKKIVERINELLSTEETTAYSIEQDITRAEHLRQSILKKAFSGQLVPQDPNDEPASELLPRIQAEKAALSTAIKKTRKSK